MDSQQKPRRRDRLLDGVFGGLVRRPKTPQNGASGAPNTPLPAQPQGSLTTRPPPVQQSESPEAELLQPQVVEQTEVEQVRLSEIWGMKSGERQVLT